MRIRGEVNENPTTRGERARAKAAARIEARHVERDYLGRPMRTPSEAAAQTLSPAAAKRAQTGAARLDAWLVAQGHAATRDKAKALIAAGRVTVDGKTAKVKPSTPVSEANRVEVLPEEPSAGE